MELLAGFILLVVVLGLVFLCLYYSIGYEQGYEHNYVYRPAVVCSAPVKPVKELDNFRYSRWTKLRKKISSSGLDLSGCNISGMSFKEGDVYEYVDFSESNLTGVDFSGCKFINCDFSEANLSKANFENCELTGSLFYGANIVGTSFKGCNINTFQFDKRS